jgi:hypothetical protein
MPDLKSYLENSSMNSRVSPVLTKVSSDTVPDNSSELPEQMGIPPLYQLYAFL